MQVIEKRCNILLAKFIISATSHKKCIVGRQVAHRVTKSRAGSVSTCLNVDEFTVHNLAVNSYRFEVAQFVA